MPAEPNRSGRDATCKQCGEPFLSRRTHLGWTKYCSQRCYGDACRKPVQLVCAVCGVTFETCPSRRGQRTCGKPECVGEMKSRSKRGVKHSAATVEKTRRTSAAKRAAREGGLIPARAAKCARPGCSNALTRQAGKYCSPRCHYDDRSRAGVSKRAQPYHRCHHCGTVFAWNGRGRGIFCSRACKDASVGRKRLDPQVVEIVQIRGHRRADFVDPSEVCRACGAPAAHVHHVIYRQHVERLKGDRWHPDDALALCVSCHGLAHAHDLPTSVLRPENLAFAVDLFGVYAVDYLRRYYHDDADPRLVAMESRAA